MNIWNTLLYQPLVNSLILFYEMLGHNLGLAIIGLTAAIRIIMIPLTKPSLEAAQKMKDLAPHLAKLKTQHKDNKQDLAKAQMDLYKKHGVNPAAGCLPQIIQFIVLIALFQAFTQVLNTNGAGIQKLNEILYQPLKMTTDKLNINFLYMDLTKPDFFKLPFSFNLFGIVIDKFPGIFLIGSAVAQFFSSKLMMPKAKPVKKEKKEGEEDMATMMQSQMLYMMPVMTLIIGLNFPSGLVLYWLAFSVFMLLQQIYTKPKNADNQKN